MGRPPCCDNDGLNKGPWTPGEDRKLVDYIQKHGHGSWKTLPMNAGLARCGKSCRQRWTNYLRPDIKRGRFSSEEEEMIIQLHSIWGNKWSAIAARLPGRTDNQIKNYWNTHIGKRLLRMGLDPVTHAPRLDLLQLSSLLNSSSMHQHQHQHNPAAQQLEYMSSLIAGLEPALVNSELLRMSTANLLSAHEYRQCQDQLQEAPQVDEFPAADAHPQVQDHLSLLQATQGGAQELVSPCSSVSNSYLHDEKGQTTVQYNMDPLQQGTRTNLLQDVASSCVPSTDGFAADSVFDKLFNLSDHAINHNYNVDSVIMTRPSSSPTALNSSLTCLNSGTAGDDKESHRTNLFQFPVPKSASIVQTKFQPTKNFIV